MKARFPTVLGEEADLISGCQGTGACASRACLHVTSGHVLEAGAVDSDLERGPHLAQTPPLTPLLRILRCRRSPARGRRGPHRQSPLRAQRTSSNCTSRCSQNHTSRSSRKGAHPCSPRSRSRSRGSPLSCDQETNRGAIVSGLRSTMARASLIRVCTVWRRFSSSTASPSPSTHIWTTGSS